MKRTTTHPGDVLKDIEIASNHKNCLGKESGNKYALFFDIDERERRGSEWMPLLIVLL